MRFTCSLLTCTSGSECVSLFLYLIFAVCFRCNFAGCCVKKEVDSSVWLNDVVKVTVNGEHSHPVTAGEKEQVPEEQRAPDISIEPGDTAQRGQAQSRDRHRGGQTQSRHRGGQAQSRHRGGQTQSRDRPRKGQTQRKADAALVALHQ